MSTNYSNTFETSSSSSSTSTVDSWRTYYTNTAALLLAVCNYGNFFYYFLIIIVVLCGQPVVIHHAMRGKLGVSKKVALAYSAIGINELIIVLSYELTYFLQAGLLQATKTVVPVLSYQATCKLLK